MTRLNTLKPAFGAKKKATRLGRGIGSGMGKTCGRGHKGQKARAGGYHKVGFEGGQMPLQRRLPKFGFNSRLASVTAEVRLGDLEKIEGNIVDMNTLILSNILSGQFKRAKVILSGQLTRPITLKGIKVTVGARKVIESLGGKVE